MGASWLSSWLCPGKLGSVWFGGSVRKLILYFSSLIDFPLDIYIKVSNRANHKVLMSIWQNLNLL